MKMRNGMENGREWGNGASAESKREGGDERKMRIGHFAADYRKPKAEKKQALISKKRNWDDSSDSDGVNYALMDNADVEADNAELKGNRLNTLVLDNGCSRHISGYKSLLLEFEEKAGPSVSYGDGNLGYGKIKIGNVIIENVALVAGLKHNLISVSQIYDRGYHVNFYEEHCKIKAKQRKTSFKSKIESSILEPYHLLQIDLFSPVNVMSIAKKRYALVIVDEYTRYTWVYFLHTKDESPSILLAHVRGLEKGSTYKVKIIRSDNGTEFKIRSMEEFCKLKGIK
ncbi:hypothetical protein AgCh_031161 [Apium graveolens]